MTILSLSTTNQLPPLKLPSIISPSTQYQGGGKRRDSDDWSTNSSVLYKEEYDYCYNNNRNNNNNKNHKLSVDILLLPPILTTNQQQQQQTVLPLSPPYSTCSSSLSAISSFPSSPNSSLLSEDASTSFVSNSTAKKKGSIQSLLNSNSELLALEQRQTNQFYSSEQNNATTTTTKNNRKRSLTFVTPIAATTTTVNNNNSKKQKTTATTTLVLEDTRQIKGLRLFSKQVCDKVAEKKTTTYNEVADELATEIQHNSNTNIDQKNIRRRVYDALNVLMALDIITKDRKEIKWVGLPATKQQQEEEQNVDLMLEKEIQFEETRQKKLLNSIQHQQTSCHQAFLQLNRLKDLANRNRHYAYQQQQGGQQIHQFPFFLIQGPASMINIDYIYGGKEATLSYQQNSSSLNIYRDVDILATLWPSSHQQHQTHPISSTITTVS